MLNPHPLPLFSTSWSRGALLQESLQNLSGDTKEYNFDHYTSSSKTGGHPDQFNIRYGYQYKNIGPEVI
jgi:hypothetical protein